MGYYKTSAEIRPADVSVITVPHTGTHWISNLLESMALEVRRAHLGAVEVPFWTDEKGPIVVPLRDPMMVAISCVNRDHHALLERLWGFKEFAGWLDWPNVFFFRLDVAEDRRSNELCALSRFLGVAKPADVDWSPANAHPDAKNLKAPYLDKGVLHPQLDRALEILADPMIYEFFRAFGYDTPWMRKVAA
jgi:hypothetical protein